MKTIVDIYEEVFLRDGTLLECYEYYEKRLKQYGFVLDKKDESVFKEYDRSIILKEGDKIVMDGIGLRIIAWKCYDIDNDIMTYFLKEE